LPNATLPMYLVTLPPPVVRPAAGKRGRPRGAGAGIKKAKK